MLEMYSVSEVAVKFGKSARTVRTWIGQGRLRACRIGNTYVVTQDAIDHMMRLEHKVDRKRLAREFIEFMQSLNIPRGTMARVAREDLRIEEDERMAR